MTRAAGLTFLLAIASVSCRTAANVASTSAEVVTAPAHYVGSKFRHNPDTTTETTDTTVYEGQPVQLPPEQPQATPPRPREKAVTSTTASQPPQHAESPAATARPSETPRSSSSTSAAQFPVAKPVPGKPGYVFSPYDPNGGYVDVTGYESGRKVKDPYSQKIFLVP